MIKRYICGPEWDRRVVTINTNPKSKIGILMTGGMDSWVLYNLLIKQHPPELIQIFNIDRGDGIDTKENVEALTGRSDITSITMLRAGTRPIANTIDQVLDDYPEINIYSGVNVIPHTEYFPEFADDERPRRPWKIDWPTVRVPFHHVYKYHILELANQLDIDVTNTLSCTHQAGAECGVCWQCREKKWAYEQLGR